MKQTININGLVAVLLGGTLCVAAFVLFWQTNRGLGLADEGIYILASRYPGEIQQNVSAIYTYLGATFELVDYDLPLFRSIWIVITLCSSVALWFGFSKLLSVGNVGEMRVGSAKFMSLAFIGIGTVLHYQWSYVTPSYYTLTAVDINLLIGLIFFSLALASDRAKLGRAYLACATVGIVIGETLFFKFPTAILAAVLATLLLCLWRGISRGAKCRMFLSTALGFAAWAVFYGLFVQRPDRAWQMFRDGWELYQTLGLHSPKAKVLAYPKEIGVLLYTGLYQFLPCYVPLTIAYFIQRRSVSASSPQQVLIKVRWLVLGAIGMALLITVLDGIRAASIDRFNTTPIDGRTLSYLGFEIAWIQLLLVIWVVLPSSSRKVGFPSTNIYLVLLFLFAMPFSGAAGTSNPIYNVISFYAAPWFCLIFLLLIVLRRSSPEIITPNILPVVILLVGAYISSHVIQGSIFQPAQLKPRNMLEQTVPTLVGDPPTLLQLDPGTHDLVAKLANAGKSLGFVPGADIIAFNEQPALVYALGGRSPGHPVFPCCRDDARNAYSRMALTFASHERLQKAFVLLSVTKTAEISEILDSAGLNFPENYRAPVIVSGPGYEYALYKPLDWLLD